jgi:hypothetical protein
VVNANPSVLRPSTFWNIEMLALTPGFDREVGRK